MLTFISNLTKNWYNFLLQQRFISSYDITLFLRQFATLITAGVQITHALSILENLQEKPSMRLLVYGIKRDILTGKNLFMSMYFYRHYFDDLVCHMIKIGEQTGKLMSMLNMIATYQEKRLEFQKRIKQALFYPTIIFFTACLLTLFSLMFIIPQFAELFRNAHLPLPFITVCLFTLADKLEPINILISGTVLGIIAFIYYRYVFPQHKKQLPYYLMKWPLLKTFIHKMWLARFSRHLAISYAAGMPIKEAIFLTINSSHVEFARLIADLCREINKGHALHRAMEGKHFFPGMMIQMVKIGEETGMLQQMLEKTADFFETDMEKIIARLPHILEPLIMIILGALIGGIVIGMYLPIINLGSAL